MKTIYALMIGEKVIEKNEIKSELWELQKKYPGSYICIWLGRLLPDNDQTENKEKNELKELNLFDL